MSTTSKNFVRLIGTVRYIYRAEWDSEVKNVITGAQDRLYLTYAAQLDFEEKCSHNPTNSDFCWVATPPTTAKCTVGNTSE